jgi:hypothetical protein
MEQNHLLSGKNTRKAEPGAENGRVSTTRKTVWLVLLVVAVAGVLGYALTMTPLESIREESRVGTKERREPHATSLTARLQASKNSCARLKTTPRDPTVLIYNRVPKAGSSSMTSLISKLSSKHKFKMLGWFDLPSHDFEAVQAAVEDALAKGQKTVIAQHFHFPEIFHEDVAYINVLREPVSRCTSQYYYLRYGDRREEDRKKVLDKFGDLTIDECISSGKHSTCFNCDGWKQSLFFCGPDGGECSDLSPDKVFAKAKQVIDTNYVVGVIEDFEGTVAVMEKLFPTFFEGGLELLKKVKPQRVTQGSSSYVPPSNSSIAVIKTILEQDEQLYEYVKGNLDAYKRCLLN